ncbi:MAG: methyltransferase domain-containing protein [Fibromonadaceae bacterium]|nr:methyltransferase domain-containing protein [Fibromonadaceae bacterium]
MSETGLAPRLTAFHALLSWKKGQGFVQNNLQQSCENLPQNDRALAYEIAMGTCRTLSDLDEKLKSLMRELPEEPYRTILEISLYQLLCTRIPPYAVVNSAVNLTRNLTGEHKVKFVNAILRNALRKNFAKINSMAKAPPQWLRVNTQKTSVKDILLRLALQEPKTLFDKFILVPNAGEFLKNPLFEKGFYSFQNPASFFMAKMCEIKSGHKIWDACAAPGGKTAMLAEENPGAFFFSTDSNEKRSLKLFDLQKRLGLKNVHIAVANAQNSPCSQKFDCIIADVPCSNMGVASRRPEVLQGISKEKIEELAKKQLAILQGVCSSLKNGGILIYSVCSQEKEETSEVVENFLKSNPNFTQEESILTNLPEVDNFFMAKLKRNGDD